MTTKIGPAWASELQGAGLLGLPFSWDVESGEFHFSDEVTPTQREAVEDLLAHHDPAAPAPQQ